MQHPCTIPTSLWCSIFLLCLDSCTCANINLQQEWMSLQSHPRYSNYDHTHRYLSWVEVHFGEKTFIHGDSLLDGTWGDCLWKATGHGLWLESRYLVTGNHSHWDCRWVPTPLRWAPNEGSHEDPKEPPTHLEAPSEVVQNPQRLHLQVWMKLATTCTWHMCVCTHMCPHNVLFLEHFIAQV